MESPDQDHAREQEERIQEPGAVVAASDQLEGKRGRPAPTSRAARRRGRWAAEARSTTGRDSPARRRPSRRSRRGPTHALRRAATRRRRGRLPQAPPARAMMPEVCCPSEGGPRKPQPSVDYAAPLVPLEAPKTTIRPSPLSKIVALRRFQWLLRREFHRRGSAPGAVAAASA